MKEGTGYTVLSGSSRGAIDAMRRRRKGDQYEGLRDIWAILGYTDSPTMEEYLVRYRRQDICRRIVSMWPSETWRKPPTIDAPESSIAGPLDELNDRVGLWAALETVDRISGIGRYGGLLVGVKGDSDLSVPMRRLGSLEDVAYLQPFHEFDLRIDQFEGDMGNPRYGMPKMYKAIVGASTDERTIPSSPKQGTVGREIEVHPSRVVHVMEGSDGSRVYGTPRLEPVLNRLYDLEKLAGGSVEILWQNAARIIHVDLDHELEYDDDTLKKMKDEILSMLQGVRRTIVTEGVQAINSLTSESADPSGHFAVLKMIISSACGIPNRILFGSEQGERASTEDKREWYGNVLRRQLNYAEPCLLRPFIDMMMELGALPTRQYKVVWPDLYVLNQQEMAMRARALAMAAKSLRPDNPGAVFAIEDIRESAGLDPTPPPEPEPLPVPEPPEPEEEEENEDEEEKDDDEQEDDEDGDEE